ncbi:METRL-like protein, partial [Mya arenaria]
GGDDVKGVHVAQLTCQSGSVTWYNPTSALRLEVKPQKMRSFTACMIIDSDDVMLKMSRENDITVNTRSPTERTRHVLNDHNLKEVYTGTGRSQEICLTSKGPLSLYLEAEESAVLGSRKVVIQYDISEYRTDQQDTSIEECRPCSPEELLTAYCSSDFVVVGKMNNVEHFDQKTRIGVAVTQIVRQIGSHFTRMRRDTLELQGTVTTHRKCGVVKGDGMFLLTGRERLGELRLGCAPYLDEWESIVSAAERDGKLQCIRE